MDATRAAEVDELIASGKLATAWNVVKTAAGEPVPYEPATVRAHLLSLPERVYRGTLELLGVACERCGGTKRIPMARSGLSPSAKQYLDKVATTDEAGVKWLPCPRCA